MNIRVQYMAQLRAVAGRAEEVVEVHDGSSLADLLAHLAALHPDAASHLVAGAGTPRPSLLVVVNGTAVSASQAAGTMLRSEDVVLLMPPIAGG